MFQFTFTYLEHIFKNLSSVGPNLPLGSSGGMNLNKDIN